MSGSKSKSKGGVGSAAIFFFKWTSTALDSYTKTIKANYLRVLAAHCTRARTGDDDSSKSFDFSELGANPRVVKDDREDIRRRLKDSKNRIWTNEEAKPDTPVSLAELACHYRLKTLIKSCESLSELLAKMAKWLEENKKAFSKATGLSEMLELVRKMFESVCAIGEVFRLTSISWPTAKYSKVLKPGSDEYQCAEDGQLEISKAEKYCPKFMGQINSYRTLVYNICCSFDGIMETVSVSFDLERIGVRQKYIKAVLHNLPPQFMCGVETTKYSSRAMKLLANPPKNENSFPMKSMSSQKSDKSAKESSKKKKSAKVFSSKYYHARNTEERSPSLKSDGTQDSAKSKSKSKSESKKKSVKSSLKKLLNSGSFGSKKSAKK